jgi:hypothetical protein
MLCGTHAHTHTHTHTHPHAVFPSPTEWKAAFQLESACILDELRCWLTRVGPEEDVLGLPLTYTQNPATKK